MIVRVPLPEYMPDQSVNSNVLLTAENVIPALDGYRPLKAFATVSDPLAGAFQGGSSAISSSGETYMLAGTSAALYRLQDDNSWVSMISGLTVTGRWEFVQFGDYVVSVNGSLTREVDLAGGTAGEIVAAPTGTSIAVIGDHVVIGQADGDIASVKWSAFRDHTAWTDGTNQAGSQPMQTGGAIMGIAGGEYGVILQRERLVRMSRTGDSDAPFVFDEISANFGCASGATIAQAGRTVFFRSDRGFMALEDGQDLRPIGSEKVDRTFDAAVARDSYDAMYTAVDPQNKLVFWVIPGAPGTVWIYNFELERWATGSFNVSGVFPGFIVGSDVDAPALYFANDDDEIGTLTGSNLAAQMDLGYSELIQGRRARVRKVRPVTDATSGISLVLNAKARLGDSDSLTTASTLNASGVVPIRTSGRYISSSLRISAGVAWSYTQSLEVDCAAGGDR